MGQANKLISYQLKEECSRKKVKLRLKKWKFIFMGILWSVERFYLVTTDSDNYYIVNKRKKKKVTLH